MTRPADVAMKLFARAKGLNPLRRVYAVVILMLGLLALPWWLILGATPYGELIFAVCVLFMLFSFGLASLVGVRSVYDRSRRLKMGQRGAASSGRRRLTEIRTGSITVAAAMVQALLIPTAVLACFLALAIEKVLVIG